MIGKIFIKKAISAIVIFIMVFACLPNEYSRIAQAAMSSKDLASTYLNTTIKYLNFSQKDTLSYDFNIKKGAQKKGALYTWYVKEDKGDKDVVTINSKTGIVTAKKAGTAYISCKITLTDGTVLGPEAMVVVRNNITVVDISNMPKDQSIITGVAMDFNRVIINTDAGNHIASKGITRWEIDEDTAGINNITESGIVTPTKKGSFSVRAVCFQSKEKYSLWLENKEENKKYVTASSKWYKVMVKDAQGTVTVATQEELIKSLATNDITQITISTKEAINFNIAKGNYLNISLIVDAPNADINNYAVFKNIIIRAIKENTWNENANGNSFYVTSIKIRIIVNGQAEVKEIIFDTDSSTLFLEIEGTVHQITILQPLELNLSGNGEQIPITIEKTGDGSKITTSIPLSMECDENSEIILNPGAEGTIINKSESTIEVKVQNNSNQSVIITTDNTGGVTINAGESGVSNGTEQSVTPASPTTLINMTIKTPATKTTYLVGDTLDISGLVIEGLYSNNRKDIMEITAANITGFNSSAVVASQLLTITVDGKKVTYTIEIKPVLVTNISISPTIMTLTAGGVTGALSPTIYPANATNKLVTWSSSDEAIATVNNGVITPVASGTATITVTTEDGNKAATCEVTVNLLILSTVNLNILAGTLTETTEFMEYSIDSTNGIDGNWTNCTAANTSVTFGEGKIYIRAKAEPDNIRLVTVLTAPPAPTLIFDDVANSITGLGNTYEYKIDAGAWTSGEVDGDFTGTKAVQIRLKATAGVLPSQIQTINFTTNLVLTGVGINVAAGNITGTTTLMQYSLNSTNGTDGTWVDCTAPSTAVTFAAGKVYVRAKIQPLNFRLVDTLSYPAAPTSGVTYSIMAGTVGNLAGIYEYSINGGAWSTTATGVVFVAGPVTVRTKATADALPSLAETIATIAAEIAAPTLVFDDVANSITGLGNTYEYKIGTGEWTSGEVDGDFTGTKIVQIRLKATVDVLASQIQTINFTTNLDLTGVGINIAAGNITGTTTLMQYSLISTNGVDGTWVDCTTPGTVVTFVEGKVYVRAIIQPLNFRRVATLSAPEAPISGVTYSIMAKTISNLAGIYEYSINGVDWSTTVMGVAFVAGPIKVRTKATADALPSLAETIATIAAEIAAPTLVFDDVANSITGLGNTYEYKIDAGAWTSGEVTGDFTGTKTVQIRLKATAHVLSSQIQTINFTTNLDLTGVGINVAAGNITGTTTLMQYSLSSTNGTDGTWVDCTASSTVVSFAAGKVYVRAKIQPLNFSRVTTLSYPEAPTSGVTYSIMAGTIGNLADIYKYSINGGAWSTSATGVVFVAGPIKVRTKATADALPSLAETIATIAEAVTAPALIFDDVANSITGLGKTYEYKIGTGEWTSGEVDGDFTGTKIVLIRLKATADVLPSQIQTINFTTNLDLTGVGIIVEAGSITGTTIQMQYSINSTNGTNGVWVDCSTGSTSVTFDEGPVYVRAKVQSGNFRLVDTVTPILLSVTAVNSSTTDGYYKASNTILITIVFGGSVNVTGTPVLSLETGTIDRLASYVSGSGGAILTFNYTVQAADISLDLDYTTANALILNGGTIRAKGTVFNADLTLPSPGAASSLGYSSGIIIDNTAPTIIYISATNTIPGSGNVILTAVGGPLSIASWNNILNLIKTNTNVAGNWITGITADKLTITPSIEGSTATLNNTNTTAATIVKDFIIPASLVVDKAGNIAASDIRINACNSSVTSIAITNSSIIYSINNGIPDLYAAFAKTAGQLKNALAGTDESPQTYSVTDSADNPKSDASILLLGDKLIVTSESGLSQMVYPIRVAPEPITTIQLKVGALNAESTLIDNDNKLYILSRVTDMTVGQIKSALESTDGSTQTYEVTDLLGQVISDDGATVSSSNRLIVTAYDGVTKSIYEIRVDWVTISVGHISVVEGNSGTVNAVFVLRRLGAHTSALTLPYNTEYIMSGVYPADEESDYIGISGNIIFAPEEVIKTLTIQIIGDTVHEEDEVFRVKFIDYSDPSVPAPFSKTCTIINDD